MMIKIIWFKFFFLNRRIIKKFLLSMTFDDFDSSSLSLLFDGESGGASVFSSFTGVIVVGVELVVVSSLVVVVIGTSSSSIILLKRFTSYMV